MVKLENVYKNLHLGGAVQKDSSNFLVFSDEFS